MAAPGNRLISADYSQIELRLLAHMADIPELRKAFEDGIDIHAATASAMFGVPLKEMTPDLRRRAKTINFGIIYGISAFGLADRLGIGREEASAFIKQYFEQFPGIRDYIDTTKRSCRDKGYVTTLFGRVCHYPQIRSNNPSERASVERQAINAPIQGSAADIIRRAMTRMEPALAAKKLKARMLLQVHDELVFEVAEDEVEAAIPVIASVMEEAPAPALTLRCRWWWRPRRRGTGRRRIEGAAVALDACPVPAGCPRRFALRTCRPALVTRCRAAATEAGSGVSGNVRRTPAPIPSEAPPHSAVGRSLGSGSRALRDFNRPGRPDPRQCARRLDRAAGPGLNRIKPNGRTP